MEGIEDKLQHRHTCAYFIFPLWIGSEERDIGKRHHLDQRAAESLQPNEIEKVNGLVQ